MKTNSKKKKKATKKLDAVKIMREIRDQISKEIKNMDFDELKSYFSKNRLVKSSR